PPVAPPPPRAVPSSPSRVTPAPAPGRWRVRNRRCAEHRRCSKRDDHFACHVLLAGSSAHHLTSHSTSRMRSASTSSHSIVPRFLGSDRPCAHVERKAKQKRNQRSDDRLGISTYKCVSF